MSFQNDGVRFLPDKSDYWNQGLVSFSVENISQFF